MKNFGLIILFIFLISSTVIANGVGNTTEKTVNGFSFEFGIEPKEPKVNERVTMSLSIHNSSTKEAIQVEDLWVRISKDNEIFFTSTNFKVHRESPLFMSYLFKESGDYVIDFSIKYKNQEIKTDFNINVYDENKGYIILVLVFIVLFIILFLYKIMRKLRSTPKKNI